MIGRPKKTFPAKFSALTQAMTSFKGKCKTTWLFGRQVWYIPFLWSLAWYSYWIFHSIMVLKSPLLQISAIDYLGAGISMAALLIAGYRAKGPIQKSVTKVTDIGNNMKKAFSHDNHRRETGYFPPLSRRTPPHVHVQNADIPQLKVVSKLSIKRQIKAEVTVPPRKSVPPISRTGEMRGSTEKSVSSSGDFSMECLMCSRLINCTNRHQRAAERSSSGGNTTPCRFATGFTESFHSSPA